MVRMAGLVRPPQITELRSFCAAAEAGSLGRAALRLSVSQPALTKRINGLEQLAGVQLLERTSRGVALTPAGRRLYDEASRLMEHVASVEEVILGLRASTPPIRLAASHSATEAFVASALAPVTAGNAPTVELITANSHVVRRLVAEGAAEIGVAAGRPSATPSPAVHRTQIAEDAIVCAVPRGHQWAQRRRITQQDLIRTPMVLRDPGSNARWTVEAELRGRGLELAPPIFEAATPAAALREALARNAPVLLSRHVLDPTMFVVVDIDGLTFPRCCSSSSPPWGTRRRRSGG